MGRKIERKVGTKQRASGRHWLHAATLARLPQGYHADGAGLYLSVQRLRDTDTLYRSWVLRYSSPTRIETKEVNGKTVHHGRRRDLGLGPLASVSIDKARTKAQKAREQIEDGIDPLDAKHADRTRRAEEWRAKKATVVKERTTLLRLARQYHEEAVEPVRTTTHAREWIASVERHVPAKILGKSIADINTAELLDFLRPLLRKHPETGKRVRSRLVTVFNEAAVRGLVAHDPMPAVAKATHRKKSEEDAERTNYRMLPYPEVPAFIAEVRQRPGVTSLALEFSILTVARTNEIRGMVWSEVDLESKLWTVPKERMKAKKEHRVPLSDRAVEILAEIKRQRVETLEDARKLPGAYVFAGRDPATALSNNAMLILIERMGYGSKATQHGFRASFRTWAAERAMKERPEIARPDVIEACLAHKEPDAVVAAYKRTTFEEDRGELLAMWAAFIEPKKAAVIEMPKKAGV